MVILRYFRLICVSGVVVSAVSFVCGTLAIGTGSWLLSQGEVEPLQYPPVASDGPLNLTDLGNLTWDAGNASSTAAAAVNIATTATAAAAAAASVTISTTTATAVSGPTTAERAPTEASGRPALITGMTLSTGTGSGGNGSNTGGQGGNVVITTSGLWHICQADITDGVVTSEWQCWNVIQNLATLQTKHLVYFQSLLAFELISVAATLAGCCVATVAIYKQQPLAVLVAAFTMFFSGMFMLVGHLMMLSIHKTKEDESASVAEIGWYYGWSFLVAWVSFCLCLVSGMINCVVYRNFRKMSEELTGTPSRVKYANRPPPVTLGSSI